MKGAGMKKFTMSFIVTAAVLSAYWAGGVAFSEDQGEGSLRGAVSQNVPDEAKDRNEKNPGKEYWCSQGTLYSSRIEEAKKEISAILEKFPEKKTMNLDEVELPDGVQQMKLNSSRMKLKQAEKDLSQLEEDAKIRGVPPGWIRCQF
jgi:hypothetical protein